MGAWFKIFTDGSRESGTDGQIESGKASWSRGRLDSIDYVILINDVSSAILKAPDTEWHQFDRLIVGLGGQGQVTPTRVARVVQAKILPHHVGMSVVRHADTSHFDFYELYHSNEGFLITKNYLGKWITIVVRKNSVSINISDKGKMPDDDKILEQHS